MLPDLYVQPDTSCFGANTWVNMPMQERCDTMASPILIESVGFYFVSISGKYISGKKRWLHNDA